MKSNLEVLLYHKRNNAKISVILIDWGVRESFHSLHYLNRQTADRRDYELIWLEFYGRKPDGLHQMIASGDGRFPVLDKFEQSLILVGCPITSASLSISHRFFSLILDADKCFHF